MTKLLSKNIRLLYRFWMRRYRDFISGAYRSFARERRSALSFEHSFSLTQPIMKSTHLQNKIHNIRNGVEKIEWLVILPNEVFSFWNTVKCPNKRNGYKLGRNIINGEVSEDYGGGLCQLASIMYHTSIICGMTIAERHNHSVDIYNDDERFTPLGADASVVYGYKDLRIRNNYAGAVKFTFDVTDESLTCVLSSSMKIDQKIILFKETKGKEHVEIVTASRSAGTDEEAVINKAMYKKKRSGM